jgi:triosephosphate isomerase
MRRPLIAANWKMNLGRTDEALALVRRLRPALSSVTLTEVAICPPFTVLPELAAVLGPSAIALGAQTMHWEDSGAHTGEVSPVMLEGRCDYVIIGHSERRASQGTSASDRAISRKVRAALDHGIAPIVCVGESGEQRDAGATDEFVGEQVRASLAGVAPAEAERLVFAYEPIWAIGSGRAATPADANRVIGLTIRGAAAEVLDEPRAQRIRVLYGGSVNTNNIAKFMRMPEIDGALVGGASLTPEFADLVRAAEAERNGPL